MNFHEQAQRMWAAANKELEKGNEQAGEAISAEGGASHRPEGTPQDGPQEGREEAAGHGLCPQLRAQTVDQGRTWVGVSAESVSRQRADQLVRLRHILADMGPSGLNELNDEAIRLVLHCIRARETSRWYPTGAVSERMDREIRRRQG